MMACNLEPETDPAAFYQLMTELVRGKYPDQAMVRGEDHFPHCPVCGNKLINDSEFPPGNKGYRPVFCSCRGKKMAADKLREKVHELRKDISESGYYAPGYERCTFAADWFPDSEASKISRAYVARWEEMRKAGKGLLYCGTVGAGKSFYAAAVVNALVEQDIKALITPAAHAVRVVLSAKDQTAALRALDGFRLLVLDDLGAEGRTEAVLSVLLRIIDRRCQQKKPILVTTNLTGEELRNPTDMACARIYDRVLSLCPAPVILAGDSFRQRERAEGRARMDALLRA